ncbi:MAG: hypothetical protein O9301_06955 [Leptospira sp.]|nr:hypothetical protein [Leptospira sp.]
MQQPLSLVCGVFFLIATTSILKAEETRPNQTEKQHDEEPSRRVQFYQYLSNDNTFRGFSVLGNKLSQRDNTAYNSVPQAWNITTGVSFQPSENLTIGINIYTPTAHRSNKDNDYFLQSSAGDKEDFTKSYIESVNSGNPNILINDALTRDRTKPRDPSSIRFRKEKNGLQDFIDASVIHKYNTKFGKIITGSFMANNPNYNVAALDLIAGLEFPFFKTWNPTLNSFFRMTSEGGGGGNGTSYHKLSISHKIFEEKDFNVTFSIGAGYQYLTNLSEKRSGISDITPAVQFNYKGLFLGILDMFRPDSRLWDTPSRYGNAGVYADTNHRDGRVDDPSKVHGIQNKIAIDLISTRVDELSAMNPGADPNGYGREALKAFLIQRYQQQNFVHHVLHFSFGYNMKF